jgi:signal transduction histidine kinase
MQTVLLIALLAGVVVVAWLASPARSRAARPDWLASAERALSRAAEPRAVLAALVHHVESGIDASHVEWWQRDEDGTYHCRRASLADGERQTLADGERQTIADGERQSLDDADASALDLWVAEARTWCRHPTASAVSGSDVAAALATTDAEVVVPLCHRGRPVGVLAIGARRGGRRFDEREITELEALGDHLVLVGEQMRMAALLDESRRMLQQATRLSTVGTLAAELAHEIRNPLVAVQTFLQILPERLDDPEVTVDLRGVALTELQRVARLLNELLGMARASVATFAATDLELVVEEVVRLLQVSARKKEVGLERGGDTLPSAAADASRLKQALVNLVLNAIQASPAGTTVSVTTRNTVDSTGRAFIEVAIHDEGPGIPESQRETIFHPFFTTKDNGTGLGLPVTRQIVADHGGSVAVEGPAGSGATFVVRLPLTLPPVERRNQAA